MQVADDDMIINNRNIADWIFQLRNNGLPIVLGAVVNINGNHFPIRRMIVSLEIESRLVIANKAVFRF